MKHSTRNTFVGLGILLTGIAAQTSLDASLDIPRPTLRQPLAVLPFELGGWIGRDEPIDAEILERTQSDEYLNRVYEDPRRPGRTFKLWINYSKQGLNLRHSPEVCLPSGGWTKVESLTRELSIPHGTTATKLTRLVYSQGDSLQGIGFWYYIFGEGPVERFVRTLPIGSRSGHGRATRGSGLTIEVFHSGDLDIDGKSVSEFCAALLDALEPILPAQRASYFVP